MIETVYLISDNENDVVDDLLKDKIKNVLDVPSDLEIIDLGRHDLLFTKTIFSKLVSEDEKCLGISFSGDIISYCVGLNKSKYVRAVPAFDPAIIQNSRIKLDANVLCVSYNMFTFEDNRDMIKTFIDTKYEEDIETFINIFSIES